MYTHNIIPCIHVHNMRWWTCNVPIHLSGFDDLCPYYTHFPPENNSEESKKKKKNEDDGKSAASNGETGQSTTPTPMERGKGKLEKKKKGKDKSEGRVIYDKVREREAMSMSRIWITRH